MATVITVAELLRHRSPLSSHASHLCCSQTPPPSSSSSSHSLPSTEPSSSNISLKRKLTQENRTPLSEENLLDLLENPSVLIGRIQLWNCSSHSSSKCSYLDCLAFSDDSETICCAVQEINPQILGKLVRINSWSFIPRREERGRKIKDNYKAKEDEEEEGKDRGRGCLEIRVFNVLEEICSASQSVYLNHELASLPNFVMETPPSKQKKTTGENRICVAGCVTFIGPPFSIPYGEIRGVNKTSQKAAMMYGSNMSDQCFKYMTSPIGTTDDQSNNGDDALKAFNAPLLSFLVGLTVCNHTPSCITPGGCILSTTNCRNPKKLTSHLAYIYFSGSPAAWRPVLLALSGRCVSISDLRRKILVAGKDRTQYSTYAATRASIVSSLPMDSAVNMQRYDKNNFALEHKHKQNACQGKDLTSYIGVVTGMFIRGKLLELDGCIWLLLIHQPLSQVHGLRVGATVAAHYVHFLRLKGYFECSLLMAACSISHVVVTHFSPYRTIYAGKWALQSSLGRFIESLSFLSAFRAMQIITNLKLKFECFNSEKEVLCSTKIRSITENYIRSIFSFGTSQFRDVFSEFFSHSTSCRLSRSDYDHFTFQVPPINNFCKQICIMWHNKNSCVWKQEKRSLGTKTDSTELKNNFTRRVLSSDMLGIVLLGFLQFSHVSGRLQLIDATGAIDVLVPDLETSQYFQEACQGQTGCVDSPRNTENVSCRQGVRVAYECSFWNSRGFSNILTLQLVTTYDLVIEGYVNPSSCSNIGPKNSPMSWHTILKETSGNVEVFRSVSFFLIFRIKDVYFMQHMKPSKLGKSSLQGRQVADNARSNACNFYMLLVLHKYPLRIKSFEKLSDETSISFCIEAIRIPFTLCMLHQLKGCEKMHDLQGSSMHCIVSRLCQSKPGSRVPGMLRQAVDQKQHTGAYDYINHCAILKKEDVHNEPRLRRVLLQFRNRDIEFHERIKIGQYYLMESLPPCAVVTVDTRKWFLSMVVEHTSEIQMSPSETAKLPLVDIILKVPLSFKKGISSVLEDARKHLSPILSVSELRKQKMHQGGMLSSTRENLEQSGLSKGSLISFFGTIEQIQSFPFIKGGCLTRINQRIFSKMLVVRDLHNSCLVKVKLDPDHHFLPPGFGPTAVVSLHRALLQLSSGGEMILNCVSSTLVIVNSIVMGSCMQVDETWTSHKGTVPLHKIEMHSMESTKIDSLLRFDCSFPQPKLLKIQCQVVSIERILLEKKDLNSSDGVHSHGTVENINYTVSFMCFTIDDGYGITKCWAKDDVAAGFLNIPVHIDQPPVNSISTERMISARRLNLLLEKYGMIMLHSMGNNANDVLSDRIVFQVGEDRTLDIEDHKFLYALVKKACHRGRLEIIAECCEPAIPLNNTGLNGWDNYTDTLHLQAKIISTLNYERHSSLICEELSETLKK